MKFFIYFSGIVKILGINLGTEPITIERGDCCAQMLVIPYAQFTLIESEVKRNSVRDTKGFGSTGPKATIAHNSEESTSAQSNPPTMDTLETFDEIDFSWLTAEEEKNAIDNWFSSKLA